MSHSLKNVCVIIINLRYGLVASTEAILLTALLHGNCNVIQLKIVKSIITNDAAVVIRNFLQTNSTLKEFELAIKEQDFW